MTTTANPHYRSLVLAFGVAIVVSVAATLIWVATRRHVESIHYTYLLEKATLTAQKNYERDEMPARSYDTLLHRYARLLPTASEVTVDSLSPHAFDTLRHYMGEPALQRLLDEGATTFEYCGLPGAAIFYPDNEGSFFVLVYAPNAYGQRLAHIIFGVAAFLLMLMLTLLAVAARWHAAYERERLFVSNASHQLNNPLTALRGECELALMRERSADLYRDALLRIAEQTERMGRTLDSMLLLAGCQRDEMTRQQTDLIALCHTVAARHPRTVVSGQACQAFTNADLLELLVDNIVSNACKYSDGEVTVTVSHTRRRCRIEVCDHGIGIPRSELHLIFSPFYRASNARGHEGSGIGLAIVAQAARLLNARLTVHSHPRTGTRFSLSLKAKCQRNAAI